MTGTIDSGTNPISGSTVTLWATGTSVTQVTSAVTDAAGNFALTFTCPTGNPLMFVTAAGGNTASSSNAGSGGANAYIGLASALGACGSLPATVVVNELTTAAAAYALSAFAPPAGTAAAGFQGNAIGLANAFALVPQLVTASTGAYSTSGLETTASSVNVNQQLDTVANALAACNNSNNVSGTSAACAELFSCASAGATYVAMSHSCTGGSTFTSGNASLTNTLSAALALTQNAGVVSTAGVFEVAAGGTFAPALTAAPNDWSLALTYAIKNFGPLAIDPSGDVWILSKNTVTNVSPAPLSVVQLSPSGQQLSPLTTGGWTTGGISQIDSSDKTNLAIDPAGNVWVGGASPNVAEINSQGVGVAPSNGWNSGSTGPGVTAGVAIDSSGNAWFADGGSASVFEVGVSGSNVPGTLGDTNGYPASICDCNGIAAGASGSVWLINGTGIAQLSATGAQGNILLPPNPNAGYSSLLAIAADAADDFWITDAHNYSVWKFTPSGSAGSYSSSSFPNSVGSGTAPKGIAVDGAAHKWIANQKFNAQSTAPSSISELSADGTVNLSPSIGFAANVITGAYAVAIDQSGNLWVSDGGDNVSELVGIAAPTRNPIASAVDAHSFAP